MQTEFSQIEKLRNHFNLSKIGDDCAVLPLNEKNDLLITTDLLIENIDFRLKWAKPFNIGHKSLAVSLSDIAAMGGSPTYAFISIGVPESLWNTSFLDEFYEGWHNLAAQFNVELAGGDVSKSPNDLVIDSIVIGEVKKNKAILRSTAKTEDSIYVTGKLGGASAGLKVLEKNKPQLALSENNLTQKQLQPFPHIKTGNLLQELDLATSMIDLSDGLSGDLKHLCKESKVGAKIYSDLLPLNENLNSFTDSEKEKLELVLHGGEDFELLFTVNPKKDNNKILDDFYCIGKITQNTENIELITNEKQEILTPNSYTHF